jgi:hypothetical protein
MKFYLFAPGETTPDKVDRLLLDVIKVKAFLTNGVVEIFESHQNLMGKIENNVVEVEYNSQNKSVKEIFVLDDALFGVAEDFSKEFLSTEKEDTNEICVFLFTKSVRELNEKSSIEAIQDEYEKKSVLLQSGSLSSPSTMVLEKEIEFLKKTASILKEYKVKGFN